MNEPNQPPSENSDDLQFDRAEFKSPGSADFKCVICQQPISGPYYQINASNACPSCLAKLQQSWSEGSGAARAVRALAFGAVAAALGAGIWFAITALTGYQLGLVAILVGFMVGWAVKRGGERGGWFYQTMAVALTYAAIVSTYIPPVVEAFRRGEEDRKAASAAQTNSPAAGSATNLAASSAAGTPVATTSARNGPQPTNLNYTMQAVLIVTIACAAPFFGGFQNIIGILIIGIALYEAWKLNKRVQLNISGPFETGSGPSSSALSPS
jgi:hypothetical protein